VLRLAVPLLLVLAGAISGCESLTEDARCAYVEDPSLAPGERASACLPSGFPEEASWARNVGGIVWRGEDRASGATVTIEPRPRSGGERVVHSMITDAAGAFTFHDVTLPYDMTVRHGQDVLVYRGLRARYIEPSIAIEPRGLPRAWQAKVDVRLDAPLSERGKLAFFATGASAITATGDLETGVSIVGREYSFEATLHAVEYEEGKGLESARAYGKVDVDVTAARSQLVVLHLDPITTFAEPTIVVTAPAGFQATTADLRVGFTPRSDAHFATIPLGVKARLPFIPDAGYTFRVRAERDGEIVDSGEVGFDLFAEQTSYALPEPLRVEAPAEGASLGPGDPLVVDGAGVLEHVLVPVEGGPSIRIVAKDSRTELPDRSMLGGAAGAYRWTVHGYPTLRLADELSGIDARRYRSMAASKPRVVELR